METIYGLLGDGGQPQNIPLIHFGLLGLLIAFFYFAGQQCFEMSSRGRFVFEFQGFFELTEVLLHGGIEEIVGGVGVDECVVDGGLLIHAPACYEALFFHLLISNAHHSFLADEDNVDSKDEHQCSYEAHNIEILLVSEETKPVAHDDDKLIDHRGQPYIFGDEESEIKQVIGHCECAATPYKEFQEEIERSFRFEGHIGCGEDEQPDAGVEEEHFVKGEISLICYDYGVGPDDHPEKQPHCDHRDDQWIIGAIIIKGSLELVVWVDEGVDESSIDSEQDADEGKGDGVDLAGCDLDVVDEVVQDEDEDCGCGGDRVHDGQGQVEHYKGNDESVHSGYRPSEHHDLKFPMVPVEEGFFFKEAYAVLSQELQEVP